MALGVAPYVGAWVETEGEANAAAAAMSHLTWVRGLKPKNKRVLFLAFKSHLTWVRGLKLLIYQVFLHHRKSHLTWVRGLKLSGHT